MGGAAAAGEWIQEKIFFVSRSEVGSLEFVVSELSPLVRSEFLYFLTILANIYRR